MNYNKISNQETAAEPVALDTSLSSDSASTSTDVHVPPAEEAEDAAVSTVTYITVVGDLNVRMGPGKGFECRKVIDDGFDQYGRLLKGTEVDILGTTVDGAGNTWGEAAFGYICLKDAERGLVFAEEC